MTFKEYQKKALDTAAYPAALAVPYLCLGIASEAGEVAGKMKKVIRDKKRPFIVDDGEADPILTEVGDVLWYCAMICNELGAELEDVAEHNINKLRGRKHRGVIKGSGDER